MKRPTMRDVPEELDGMIPPSLIPANADPVALVHAIRGMAPEVNDLLAATSVAHHWGSKRMPGDWALLYLAFVISKLPDVQPWYQRVVGYRDLWQACRFTAVPSLRTVELRFAELEVKSGVFEQFAAKLIQKARSRDPRVGAQVHVDATESRTHAAPRHDCQPGEGCPSSAKRQPHMRRLDAKTASEVRETRAAHPVEPAVTLLLADGLTQVAVTGAHWDPIRRIMRFRSGSHWWASRDREAGTRAYERGPRTVKAWHGRYGMVVADHFTHAPLAIEIQPANMPEHKIYERAMERVIANLGGEAPLVVAGDRGLSIESVFKFNTNRGIASVLPYRRQNGSEPAHPAGTSDYDENGIPKCRHCGGTTSFVSFRVDKGRGRVWFKCDLPVTPGCDKVQTMNCSKNYRRVLPLWRNEEAYAAMRTSHQVYEHVHNDLRTQFLVNPNSLQTRPKRIGSGVHILRAAAALLITWVRVFTSSGKLGRRKYKTKLTSGRGMASRIAAARLRRRTPVPVAGAPPPLALSPPPAV